MYISDILFAINTTYLSLSLLILVISQQGELAAGGHKAATNEKQGKKKNKATASNIRQPNPLDQTCIHPESYNIAMR